MKNHFRQKFLTEREDVIYYLETMKKGFANGTLNFSVNEDYDIELTPPKHIVMGVETTLDKGKVNFTLNFSWPNEGPIVPFRFEARH
jgi:amphi-Trp domain-containing protein